MISASHVDKAMLFCLREPHDKAADCQSTTQPEVDAAVSHDASEKPRRRCCLRVYVSPTDAVRARSSGNGAVWMRGDASARREARDAVEAAEHDVKRAERAAALCDVSSTSAIAREKLE